MSSGIVFTGRRVHHHHVGKPDDACHGRDILKKIEVELVIKGGVDRIRRRNQEERVAIGRCAHHRFGREIGCCSRPAFDDKRLAQPLLQPLRHKPRGQVRGAARWVADDQPHGPVRVDAIGRLRAGEAGGANQRCNRS
jgi:hypothetical protein